MAHRHAGTKPPVIDDFRLGSLTDGNPATDFAGNVDLESVRYADVTLSQLSLPGARLDGVHLARVSADEVDLKGARFVEVELEQVGFAVVRAARGQWRDVKITGRLGSLEAFESQWRSVHFVGCKLTFVNLRGADLHDVLFTDCVIEDLDLMGAAVNRVRFIDSRVTNLNVQNAKIRDFDLRGATLESIDGLDDLRGTTLSSDQLTLFAPLLATHLGLKIED